MKLPRNLVLFGLAVVVVVGGLVGGSAGILLFDQPWLSYKLLPLPVVVEHVRPGETIPLRVVRCNSSSEPRVYTIARSLEADSTGATYVLPDSVVLIKPGCHDAISLANRVPLTTPPGRYRVLGLSRLTGLWRDHYVEWTSEAFEVLP